MKLCRKRKSNDTLNKGRYQKTSRHCHKASKKRYLQVLYKLNKKESQLTHEDCLAMTRLMRHGFSMQEAMHILQEKRNEKVFASIETHLAKGENLKAFLIPYLQKDYAGYVEGFLSCMPFDEAMETTSAIVTEEKKNKQEIAKGMVYPLVMFVGMTGGIYVFNELVLPSLIRMMSGFSIETDTYRLLQRWIHLLSLLLITLILVIALICIIAMDRTHIVKTYRFLADHFPNCLLVQYASRQFAGFFLQLEKRNVSTMQAIEILKQMQMKPLVQWIASQLEMHLVKGESMNDAIHSAHIETALMRFFHIAYYASDCEEMLEGYLDMVQIRTKRNIRRLSRMVQLVSYVLIGLILIIVYRILMLPMNMLQKI